MCELSTGDPKPRFDSLAEIMEHFSKVPFEQFKKELDDWFYQSLSEKGKDLNSLNCEGVSDQLKLLVQQIYQEAEVLKNKQDA
jgi:hypothetical protein